jgi:hypothetical protein
MVGMTINPREYPQNISKSFQNVRIDHQQWIDSAQKRARESDSTHKRGQS